MTTAAAELARTRGHRKREKTRSQLLAAGLRVLAAKGEALTVSDVVAEAEVSNGTFYNYFSDREELIDRLTEQLLLGLAAAVADEPIDDPALRFAVATGRVLRRAVDDSVWGWAILRLATRGAVRAGIDGYLRDDLAAGLAAGRFDVGPEDAAVDQLVGLVVMTIRRIVAGEAAPDAPLRAVERSLRALGVPADDARAVAAAALAR